jgi:hypothetical protein
MHPERRSPKQPINSPHPNQLLFFLASFLAFIYHTLVSNQLDTIIPSTACAAPRHATSLERHFNIPIAPYNRDTTYTHQQISTPSHLIISPSNPSQAPPKQHSPKEISTHLPIPTIPIQTPYTLLRGLLTRVKVLRVRFTMPQSARLYDLGCYAAGFRMRCAREGRTFRNGRLFRCSMLRPMKGWWLTLGRSPFRALRWGVEKKDE